MMYPRLRLAVEFLAKDGILFVSIDDNELHRLRELLDGLLGPGNLLACIVWQTDGNFDNQAKVKIAHEYVLAYARNLSTLPAPPVVDPATPEHSKLFRPEIRNTVVKNGPGNPVSDFRLPAGFPAAFKEGTIEPRNDKWPHYEGPVVVHDGRVVVEVAAQSGWSSKRIMTRFVDAGFNPVPDTKGQLTSFELTKTGAIEAFKPRSESQSHVVSVIRGVGTTQSASAFLAEMGLKFDYPKPVGLVRYLVSMVADRNAVVLDFFAGSGTSGQAVLEANKADGGSRRFILVELEPSIAVDIAQKRVANLVNGYTNTKAEQFDGLGGGFRFCNLGNPLLDETGSIAGEVRFPDLAAHVFFTETGNPIPARASGKTPLLGVHQGRALYLLYNGVLGDRRPGGGNVLTHEVAQNLPAHPGGKGPRVVYGDACRLGPRSLEHYGITFRQIPFELRVD
jgi:hypothetical protein